MARAVRRRQRVAERRPAPAPVRQPLHWVARIWQTKAQQAVLRKKLENIATVMLAADGHKIANILAERYPSVWSLSQASRSDLLAFKGVGDRTLNKLRSYLTTRGVKVRW